ncbi:17629_t:CDS:2, partial [Acaulospora morrowiae]
REFNHRVKSITASIFTPAEIESLKNGGNAKAAQIWLAKYRWMEFPEPNPDDVESIRNFMRAKYIQKKWLDASLLPNQPSKITNNENLTARTFVINPPVFSHRSTNFSDNSSNSSLSRHSSLADVHSISPGERRKSSVSDISSDYSFHMNNFGSLKSENNLKNSSNDNTLINIPTLPKPSSNPFTANQPSDNLSRSNTYPELKPGRNNDIEDFFSLLSTPSTQTMQPVQSPQSPVSWNNAYPQLGELNNTPVTTDQRHITQQTQTFIQNGVKQDISPLSNNLLTLQPQQLQKSTQNKQFSGITNFEFSGGLNSPSQIVQQKIVNEKERRATYPGQSNQFATLDASIPYNNNLLNFTSTPKNFDKVADNAQQTTATSKILNPFGQVGQGSMSSISSVLEPTNASSSQQSRPVSSPDPYQAFRNLDLNDSGISLTSLTGSSTHSLSPSSPASQEKRSASDIKGVFGDFVTPPTSVESFNNFPTQTSDYDLFGDFQTASNYNVFNSPSLKKELSLSSQSSFFDTQQSNLVNDFPRQSSQRSRSQTLGSHTSFSSDVFSDNLSSPNLLSTQMNPQSTYRRMSGIPNTQQKFGFTNGSANSHFGSSSSSLGIINGNMTSSVSTDPFNLSSNNPFPLISPSSTASQPPKEMGHAKKISFDSAFSDLDPLKSGGRI